MKPSLQLAHVIRRLHDVHFVPITRCEYYVNSNKRLRVCFGKGEGEKSLPVLETVLFHYIIISEHFSSIQTPRPRACNVHRRGRYTLLQRPQRKSISRNTLGKRVLRTYTHTHSRNTRIIVFYNYYSTAGASARGVGFSTTLRIECIHTHTPIPHSRVHTLTPCVVATGCMKLLQLYNNI